MKYGDDIQQFREFLGSVADGYSDDQLLQLRREMRAMAELLLDIYLDNKARRKQLPKSREAFDGRNSKP